VSIIPVRRDALPRTAEFAGRSGAAALARSASISLVFHGACDFRPRPRTSEPHAASTRAEYNNANSGLFRDRVSGPAIRFPSDEVGGRFLINRARCFCPCPDRMLLDKYSDGRRRGHNRINASIPTPWLRSQTFRGGHFVPHRRTKTGLLRSTLSTRRRVWLLVRVEVPAHGEYTIDFVAPSRTQYLATVFVDDATAADGCLQDYFSEHNLQRRPRCRKRS